MDVPKLTITMEFSETDMKQQQSTRLNSKIWTMMKHPLTYRTKINDDRRSCTTLKIKNLMEVDVNEFENQAAFKALKRVRKSVKTLIIENSTFHSSSELRSFLLRFPNVKDVNMLNVGISRRIKKFAYEKPLELPNLRKLIINECEANVISIFERSTQLENLSLNLDQVTLIADMNNIERFISNQSNVESLHLESTGKSFDFSYVESAEFTLKELQARYVSYDDPLVAFDYVMQRVAKSVEIVAQSNFF